MASNRLAAIEGNMQGGYKYTVNTNGLLSKEQRDFYEKNGYVHIEGMLTSDECDVWVENFKEIANSPEPPKMLVMKDVMLKDKNKLGEEFVTKMQDFQNDERLFSYCRHPKVLDYAESIVGPDLKACHTMLINKPPDLGSGSSRHPPHQDLWYFPFRPAERIVAAWSSLQDVNEENGCLFVVPGSHLDPLHLHEYPNDGVVNKAYHGIQGLSSESAGSKMHKVHMKKGDCLLFHPLVIHGSGRNNSQNYRKAFCCHFANPTKCDWYLDPKQDTIKQEVEEMASKKFGGAKVDFVDVWRYKSVLVRGKETTMV